MKRIDWNRLVPLGMQAETIRKWLFLAWCTGTGMSLGFFVRYSNARDNLYVGWGENKVLRAGAVMPPFEELLRGYLWGLLVVTLSMIPLAFALYSSHYQESRSIYTMKRLPNRWELWRRVLTMPVLTAVICIVTMLVLLGSFYGVYLHCTPAGCLP